MKSFEAFETIKKNLSQLEVINMNDYRAEETLLIITDMVNGFAHFGALSSPRVAAIAEPIANFAKACESKNIPIIAFADAHPDHSPEFESYPAHCVAGTSESVLVPEIEGKIKLTRIDKNSTNGYLEPEFQDLLNKHPQWKRFIVVGNCTDICVTQLAVTLKTHFNRLNQRVDVIVPVDLVDTYDYDVHEGDLMHVMGLYMMQQNGVKLMKWG